MRRLRWKLSFLIRIFQLVVFSMVVLELTWFSYVLHVERPTLKADMLAVYGGREYRYDYGWLLEKKGEFKYLVFSDQSPAEVFCKEKEFGAPKEALLLMEPFARTTDQNARFVSKLMVAHPFRSLIVVTSWWHLPRALFLTRLAFLNSGVKISGYPCGVSISPLIFQRDLWVEFLKFWGSVFTYYSDSRGHGTKMPVNE